jgi:hypothetical protein
MGLGLEAATEVVNVNGQNLSLLEDFLQLEDKDVETLCRVIRRPGGANAAGNQNQGIQVSAMAEANLKRMTYQMRHSTRVSRPFVWADISLVSVRALSAQAEMEASHKDPITLPIMDPKNWTKNFEAIDEYFRGLRGYKKSPLSYVYRGDLVPALAAVDPPTGAPGSLHISHDDKMCARGPILLAGAAVGPDTETIGPFAPSFIVDRAAVWEKLAEILLTNDAFTVIKAAKKAQNGRRAYQLLYAHYLGPNNVGNMAGEAETVLNTVQYHGEKRQWNFEKYALTHLRQHLILEALMAHGYVGIDPGSKVCFLLAGIRCSTLDAVKTHIISDEGLRVDFARCVTLFKDFVKQTAQTTNAQLGIAAMSVNDGGGGKRKGKDRWYTMDEWRALPEDEQAIIRKTRASRKNKSGGKTPPKSGPKTKRKFDAGSVQKLKDKVQNQKRQLAAMHAAAKSATDDVDGDAMESDSGSDGDQRKHSALTRQGAVPRKAGRKGGDSKN